MMIFHFVLNVIVTGTSYTIQNTSSRRLGHSLIQTKHMTTSLTWKTTTLRRSGPSRQNRSQRRTKNYCMEEMTTISTRRWRHTNLPTTYSSTSRAKTSSFEDYSSAGKYQAISCATFIEVKSAAALPPVLIVGADGNCLGVGGWLTMEEKNANI